MATTLVEPRRNGANLKKLTDQQRAFTVELLADDKFDATAAAKKAGYKHPGQAAHRLLKTKPVQRALGKAQRERMERCNLTADDVLNYLKSALFLNPLDYFYPSEKGHWHIQSLDTLPPEVGRLIESFEILVKEKIDGTVESEFKVKLVSKTAALGLAMRHTTVDKVEVKHTWDQFLSHKNNDKLIDIVETRLIEEGA